jgi:HSP20 family protein
MTRSDLAPWRRSALRRLAPDDHEFDTFRREMDSLHRSIDRMIGDWWVGSGTGSFEPELFGTADLMPQLDVTEDSKAFHVSVELPGLDKSDVNVQLADRLLTISGEKTLEKGHEDQNARRRERAYGRFHRALELPAEVAAEGITARFAKGVLVIELPKSAAQQMQATKIPVRSG